MRKTGKNNELCRKCIYGISINAGGHSYACYYIVRAHKRRNCPDGLCDKYVEGKSIGDEWAIDLNDKEEWNNGKTYEV